MVKEGHDSTVRPTLKTWEFDQKGRKYLDEWAADGKPQLSHKVLARVRFLKMFAALTIPLIFVVIDYGNQEHAASALQRRLRAWWCTVVQLDDADVAKARTVSFPRSWQVPWRNLGVGVDRTSR